MSGIYKIVNTANGKFYVGSSVQIESRIFQHLGLLRKGKHNNGHMQSAFAIYGEDAFDFALIEACDRCELLAREQYHIDALQPEYNICKFAGNTLGVLHNDAAKAKMTAANIGNKRMLGKSHSKETKEKLRAKAVMRTHTEEVKARISQALIGNSFTLGHKLSDMHKQAVAKKLQDSWNGVDGVKARSREAAADRARARWENPEWKAVQSEKIRIGKANRLATQGNHYDNQAHKSKLEIIQKQ